MSVSKDSVLNEEYSECTVDVRHDVEDLGSNVPIMGSKRKLAR